MRFRKSKGKKGIEPVLLRGILAGKALDLMVVLLLSAGTGAAVDAPSWWSQDEAPVLAQGKDPDNLAVANIGQAKWMARNALDALRKVLPDVAEDVEADLVGPGKPIPDWDPPASAGERSRQHAPLLIGQLKAISAPFYERIQDVAPGWLASERAIYQMPATGTFYPWTPATTDDSNRAPATLGQLKAVFSLDFMADREAADAIPDLWEHAVVNADPNDAWTSIGSINAQNAQQAATETQSNPPPRDPLASVEAVWKVDARDSWYHYTEGFPNECFVFNRNSRVTEEHELAERISRIQMLESLDQDCPFEAVPPADATGLTEFYNHVMTGPGGEQRIWNQGRVWLTVNPAPLASISKTMLLVREAIEDEDSSVTVIDVLHFTVPAGQTCSVPQDVVHVPEDPAMEGYREVIYDLVPLEVVELSPKVKDESGFDISGSEKPAAGKPLTPFVELNPVADRIAHRELKVKIGEVLEGKTVTWTLDVVPGVTPPAIRGRWDHSPNHSDGFEASSAYGANGFSRVSEVSGRTTVDGDGFTAIRVNVPPVGFNQVRLKIQIEGMTAPADLIDMEVSGVVVIDAGHGGASNMVGSSWNNATSPSGVLEKTMALDYSLALRDSLRSIRQTEKMNLRVFMTRDDDRNLPAADRAARARDNGADVMHVIHFNSSEAHTARGTLEVYRTTNNVFPQQDTILAGGIVTRMVAAMSSFDAGANHRARVAVNAAVASDENNGNTETYCPIRTSYIEVEFIDFGAQTTTHDDDLVDILLNTGPDAAAVRSAVANAMRDGILHDLRNHQPQP